MADATNGHEAVESKGEAEATSEGSGGESMPAAEKVEIVAAAAARQESILSDSHSSRGWTASVSAAGYS